MLNEEQKLRYSGIKMTDKARKDTDHYFGVGNDVLLEALDMEEDKSEPHRKVERYLRTTFSVQEYRSSDLKDLIHNEYILDEYLRDNTRLNTKPSKRYYASVVRGVQVANQTNPLPTKENPTGHSWKDISCKNIETGTKREYLAAEIQHGTVVVFVHDPDDKEVYRATLQPYHSDAGEAVYMVNAEYGIEYQPFLDHAQGVAQRLSGENKRGVFKIHPEVYSNDRARVIEL